MENRKEKMEKRKEKSGRRLNYPVYAVLFFGGALLCSLILTPTAIRGAYACSALSAVSAVAGIVKPPPSAVWVGRAVSCIILALIALGVLFVF